MALEKFSLKDSNKVKLTEDEKEILENLKKRCKEKGIDHRMFLKKLNNLYKLR